MNSCMLHLSGPICNGGTGRNGGKHSADCTLTSDWNDGISNCMLQLSGSICSDGTGRNVSTRLTAH